MTEPVLPLDGAEAGDNPPAGGRRAVLIAVAAVTSLAVAGALTLFGGDDAEDDALLFPPKRPVAAAAEAPGAAVDGSRLPAVSDLGSGRDPFAPLYVAPVTTGSAGGASDGPTTPSPPRGETPPAAAPPAAPGPDGGGLPPSAGAPVPPAPDAPPAVPVQTTTVSVDTVRVAEGPDGQADLLVDGRPVTVGVDQVFAVAFRLVSVQEGPEGRCATLQYGEELFDLCEGDPAVVR